MNQNVPARGGYSVLGQYFSMHYEEFPDLTLKELASEFGVSTGKMRQVLRMAERPLRRKHMVVKVPTRDDGYVIVVTDKADAVASGIISRVLPITTEFERYALQLDTVGVKGVFDSIINALYDTQDELVDLVLTNGQVTP